MDKQFFESLPLPIKAFLIEYDFMYQLNMGEQGLTLYFKQKFNDKFTAYAIIADGLLLAHIKDKEEDLEVYAIIAAFYGDLEELVACLSHFENICKQVE